MTKESVLSYSRTEGGETDKQIRTQIKDARDTGLPRHCSVILKPPRGETHMNRSTQEHCMPLLYFIFPFSHFAVNCPASSSLTLLSLFPLPVSSILAIHLFFSFFNFCFLFLLIFPPPFYHCDNLILQPVAIHCWQPPKYVKER